MGLLSRSAKLVAALALISSVAAADDIDRKLTAYEAEALALGSNLPSPNQPSAENQHRLVDAEVAYSLGDYDNAALILFDLVKPDAQSLGADNDAALFYLAESLNQKGDRGAARGYYAQLIQPAHAQGKYYQLALERLVELATQQPTQNEAPETATALAALRAQPATPQVSYVLAKYAFAKGDYDGALQQFAQVPKDSELGLQAEYYTGTTAVARKDYAKATEIFTDVAAAHPRTANDRRVIELAQLALGRLYYEQDEPAKSIDAYLMVDRHSDLFPDALYEVAWVYVKGKQFDKALRALELLEASNPTSTKTPTVRILEGNLRIRKAQAIRAKQVEGTLNNNDASDPEVEYDKAAQLFTETHDQYMPSYQALSQMVDGNLDPATFIDQIAGRQSHVFQAAAPIPEAAAQWLREEPGVQRFVGVETDLGDAQANIREAEEIIQRLEGVIAAKDHSAVYPELASRRARIAVIEDDLVHVRGQLADEQLALISSSADLAQATANRKALEQQYAALGNPEQAYADRVRDAEQGYDKIDESAQEIDAAIGSAQAIAVALRKYMMDAQPAMPADQKASLGKQLDDATREAQAIEDELAELHRAITIGKDLAPIGDAGLAQARELRRQLRAAEDTEQHALDGFVAASRDPGKSRRLSALADRAWRIAVKLDDTDQTVAQAVEQGIAQAKVVLEQERGNLTAYQKELADYEQEARSVGTTVLGASFKDVKAKFYDVIVRTDVGNVDVAWSRKEDTDDDLKRLNLARARELKQLRDEFHDILQAEAKPPAKKPEPEMPAPSPEGGTSPEQGNDTRVKPAGDNKPGNTQPTVKPDEQKAAAQGTAKKGGTK